MNIKDYLNSIKKKPESKAEQYSASELLNLLTPLVKPKLQPTPSKTPEPSRAPKLTPDEIIKSINSKLNKEPPKSPAPAKKDIISSLKTKIKSISYTNNIIKDLAKTRTSIIAEENQKLINKVLPPVPQRMVVLHTPIENIFRSIINDISNFFVPQQIRKIGKRKDPNRVEIILQEENASTLKELIKGNEENFRFHTTRRLSALDISKNAREVGSRARRKSITLTNKSPVKKDNSDSESESDSEEEINCLSDERAARRDANFYNTKPELPKLEALNLRDYKKAAVSNILQVATPLETTNGEVIKFGYVKKQRAGTTNFHQRWLVLRGFTLYWYRDSQSSFAKGIMTLPSEFVTPCEVGKEKCFTIEGPNKKLTILNDKSGNGWRVILHNQICFKKYLETADKYLADFINYFQDLNYSRISIQDVEIKETFLNCLVYSLPAHTKLQTIELENCELRDPDIILLCELLMGCTRVDTLNLSKNHLGSKSAIAIATLLKQEEVRWNTLLNLNLSHNAICDEGVESLFRAFSVRFEHLYWPKAIHQLPFYSLELNDIRMEDKGLYAVCALLNKAKSLIEQEEDVEPKMKLDIGSNDFTSRAFGRFTEYMEHFHGLNSLIISNCKGLVAEDIIGLSESLRSNFSLLYLDMQGLPITRDVFNALANTLEDNYVLSCIKVSFNSEIVTALIRHASKLKDLFSIQTPE